MLLFSILFRSLYCLLLSFHCMPIIVCVTPFLILTKIPRGLAPLGPFQKKISNKKHNVIFIQQTCTCSTLIEQW